MCLERSQQGKYNLQNNPSPSQLSRFVRWEFSLRRWCMYRSAAVPQFPSALWQAVPHSSIVCLNPEGLSFYHLCLTVFCKPEESYRYYGVHFFSNKNSLLTPLDPDSIQHHVRQILCSHRSCQIEIQANGVAHSIEYLSIWVDCQALIPRARNTSWSPFAFLESSQILFKEASSCMTWIEKLHLYSTATAQVTDVLQGNQISKSVVQNCLP